MIKDNFLKNCAAPLGGSHGSQGNRGSQFGNHWSIQYIIYIILYYILLVKDLPKLPGVAARMGFEPTTFRFKSIESTNVPPRPKNFNCKKLLNDSVRLQHSRCFMNSASS